MNLYITALLTFCTSIWGFSPIQPQPHRHIDLPGSKLSMAMDDAMIARLDGIKRSYQALTERLGDPDVIADSKLLMKVMSDRSKSEDVVTAFDEVSLIIF